MRANFRGKTAAGLQGIWDLFFLAPLDAVLWGIVRPHCCEKEGQYGMSVSKCCRVSFLRVISGFHFPASRVGSVTINLPAPSKYTLQCNAHSDPFFLGYQKPKISIDHDRIEEKKVKEKGS